MRYLLYVLAIGFCSVGMAQTNLQFTNSAMEDVLMGNFIPDFLPVTPPDAAAQSIVDQLSPDSLRVYLEEMSTFGNRNTGSDTTSATFGMGAARRWAKARFDGFSQQSGGRMLTGHFQFDQPVCGMGQHRNVLGVLPGVGPHAEEFVLVEAHFDSRCEDGCDVLCDAAGMEDNGSGSALVMELARVMSGLAFDRTIVFMLTTGEEQGLIGANAFAEWTELNDLPLRAVLNNDVIGGVICGQTASPPGCPGLNDVDSTNVRIYSAGNINSKHKNLARFIKMQYTQDVETLMDVPTVINIMSPEDRTGRGGDHIPFRQRNYPAVRFTSANEHGNGNPSTPGYSDRQHTHDDELGVDTDGDGQLDSFFVDFNYLYRNAVINGYALHTAASGPASPDDFTATGIDNSGMRIEINDPTGETTRYVVAAREFGSLEWSYITEMTGTLDTLMDAPADVNFLWSVAALDDLDRESLFIGEEIENYDVATADPNAPEQTAVELLQNRPNPFDEATWFGVMVHENLGYREAHIRVQDMEGRELARLPIDLQPGLNEVLYGFEHHRYVPGTYAYSLVVDGKPVATRRMVYAW